MNKANASFRSSMNANGKELRRLRYQLGITQEQLAARIDYSDRLIRRAENGARLSYKTLLALHEFFTTEGINVDFETLVCREQADRTAAEVVSGENHAHPTEIVSESETQVDFTPLLDNPLQ